MAEKSQMESSTQPIARPNPPMMQPTPLRVHKIIAFLKSGSGPSVFPMRSGGAADGQTVGSSEKMLPRREKARALSGMSGTMCSLSSRNDDRLCRRQKVNRR